PVEGVRHMALKGKRLIDEGISHVFITLGDDGVIAMNRSDCFLCTPPKINAVDTVGCGDAFLAGALVALRRQDSFEDLCRRAVACGVSNALHHGPAEIRPEEISPFAEQVTVEKI
ncbi:MAG: PfkB family carbohydrate kinase, partial [Fibrobacterota bacterium]